MSHVFAEFSFVSTKMFLSGKTASETTCFFVMWDIKPKLNQFLRIAFAFRALTSLVRH